MKIDKVKYDFHKQRKEFFGASGERRESMRWLYETQTKYNVSFDCLGSQDRAVLLAACRLFHAVPEAVRKNIGSIQMAPEPQVYWKTPANMASKLLVNLAWERIYKLIDGVKEEKADPEDVFEGSGVIHMDMDNYQEKIPKQDDDEEVGADEDEETEDSVFASFQKSLALERRKRAIKDKLNKSRLGKLYQ